MCASLDMLFHGLFIASSPKYILETLTGIRNGFDRRYGLSVRPENPPAFWVRVSHPPPPCMNPLLSDLKSRKQHLHSRSFLLSLRKRRRSTSIAARGDRDIGNHTIQHVDSGRDIEGRGLRSASGDRTSG
jgi:hypothetical protein